MKARMKTKWVMGITTMFSCTLFLMLTSVQSAELKWPNPSYEGQKLEEVRAWEKQWAGKTVDASNVDGVKDFLPETYYDRIKHPEKWGTVSFIIIPYQYIKPTDGLIKATNDGLGKASVDNEEVLHNWVNGIPFPEPKTGAEIAWNFDAITHGDTELVTNRGWLIDGKRKSERFLGRVKIWRMYFSGRTDVPPIPEFPDNTKGYRRGLIYCFIEPQDMRGIRNLSMRYKDPAKEDDSWAFVPAMRRVRRMSTAQRGDSVGGGDNTWDDTWGWDGHIRRNKYRLLKTQEVLMGRHSDKPLSPTKGNIDHSGTQRERINCYVVEFISKDTDYVYSKRICWIDPETWRMPYEDQYDQQGRLWKTTEFTAAPVNSKGGMVTTVFSSNTIDVQRVHATPAIGYPQFIGEEIPKDNFSTDYLIRLGH
jgi:hypothetical protein